MPDVLQTANPSRVRLACSHRKMKRAWPSSIRNFEGAFGSGIASNLQGNPLLLNAVPPSWVFTATVPEPVPFDPIEP